MAQNFNKCKYINENDVKLKTKIAMTKIKTGLGFELITLVPKRVKETTGPEAGKIKTELYSGDKLVAMIPPKTKQPRRGQEEADFRGWRFRLDWDKEIE